jgi:hypothetical protein
MQISGFGSSDSSETSTANNTIHSAVSSNTYGSGDLGVFIDPLDAIAVVDETKKFTETTSAYHLMWELTKDIDDNGSLAGVQSAIDTYTSSLISANGYESAYTAPSTSFLADLNALSKDAASNNLPAAVSDLAKAKADAPQYFTGPWGTGDANVVADFTSLQTPSLSKSLDATNEASAANGGGDSTATTLSSRA